MKQHAKLHMSHPGELAAKSLAGAIRTARQARGLTQSDLAQRARISLPTLNRLEAGHPGVALWVLINILETLGLLGVFSNFQDPTTDELLRRAVNKPVRRRKPSGDINI